MPGMLHRKGWLILLLLTFALNFAWEMTQANWFANMRDLSLWPATLICVRAALGDVVIAVIALGVAALVGRIAAWPKALRGVITALTFVLVGLVIVVAYEVFALSRG